MMRLDELHPALREPSLQSVNFLNEVMSRYPNAISFAPGAPSLAFLGELDLELCIARFLAHDMRARSVDRATASRRLYEYGPSQGVICDLIADALTRDGLPTAAGSVIVTVGAQEALFIVIRALFATRDEVLLVSTPCFPGIVGAAKLLGVEIVAVQETDGGVDPERVIETIEAQQRLGRRVKAMYVAPDFSNPSGMQWSLATRRRLLEIAQANRFILIEDSAYSFTAFSEAALPSLKALDTAGVVVLVGTFAKICAPGARVGYAVADQTVQGPATATRLVTELTKIKSMLTVNTSPISQAVVGGMLLEHGGSLGNLGASKRDLYRSRLACLLSALEEHIPTPLRSAGLSWNIPNGGFFVRMNIPAVADLALLERSAERYGVLWTPMSMFHLDDSGDRQIRLSCSYLDEGQIDEGVRRLAGLLHSLEREQP